jgi:thioesterase domain-containing protein
VIKKAAVKRQYWGDILATRARLLTCSLLQRAGRTVSLDQRYFLMERAHHRALDNFVPQPYAGKLTLMRASDRGPEVLGKREDYTLGWGPLVTGKLEIHEIRTAHMYMLFEPNVEAFAAFLKTLFPA